MQYEKKTFLYILSNLHVLDALDRAVYQPDKRAKDSFVATTSIARSFPDTDAALAKINDRKNIEINCIQDIGVVDGIQSVTINDLHKKVIKRGRVGNEEQEQISKLLIKLPQIFA
ncbi:MAG: hypothetical protein BHW02_00705 [Clostridium sp. 28_12]|nr:MAG: hypothetical protein BHW02_00705 [Clostridium sp. 28_12]